MIPVLAVALGVAAVLFVVGVLALGARWDTRRERRQQRVEVARLGALNDCVVLSPAERSSWRQISDQLDTPRVRRGRVVRGGRV